MQSSNMQNIYLRSPHGATINLACRDMRQFKFLTFSRMSLKLHLYEVLQPSRDKRGEILRRLCLLKTSLSRLVRQYLLPR